MDQNSAYRSYERMDRLLQSSAHQNKTGRQVPGKIPGTYRPESSLIKLSNFKGSLYQAVP